MPPLPWFKYYPNDFFNDPNVARMTLEEIGMYHLMLRWAWNERPPGSLPASLRELSAILGQNFRKTSRLLSGTLGCCWIKHDGRIWNPRLVHEAESQQVRSAKARASIKKRWDTNVYTNVDTNVIPYKKLDLRSKIFEDSKESSQTPPTPPKGEVIRWIECFNQLTGSRLTGTEAHLKIIRGRIHDRFTVEDAELVVRSKKAEWGNDPKMRKCIRVETLFGTKFPTYLEQARTDFTPHSTVIEEALSYFEEKKQLQPHFPDDRFYLSVKSRYGAEVEQAVRAERSRRHAEKNGDAP